MLEERGDINMGSKKSFSTVATLLIALIVLSGWQPITVQAQPFAYITNEGDNTVSVIDTATNTVTATIPVGNGAWGVAVPHVDKPPGGSFLFDAGTKIGK